VGGEPFGINQSVVDDDFLGQVESVMRSLRDVDWLPATGDSEQITPRQGNRQRPAGAALVGSFSLGRPRSELLAAAQAH
jgi:hypothetical protein